MDRKFVPLSKTQIENIFKESLERYRLSEGLGYKKSQLKLKEDNNKTAYAEPSSTNASSMVKDATTTAAQNPNSDVVVDASNYDNQSGNNDIVVAKKGSSIADAAKQAEMDAKSPTMKKLASQGVDIKYKLQCSKECKLNQLRESSYGVTKKTLKKMIKNL